MVQKSIVTNNELNYSEFVFIDFCTQNNINYLKLDFPLEVDSKKKYLKDINGKCPDFLCEKKGYKFLVEVKSLHKKSAKLKQFYTVRKSGKQNIYQGVFNKYLGKVERKFDNIDDKYKYPKFLFLHHFYENDLNMKYYFSNKNDIFKSIFKKYLGDLNFKLKQGIFSKKSTINGVVFLNVYNNMFEGILNDASDIVCNHKQVRKIFG